MAKLTHTAKFPPLEQILRHRDDWVDALRREGPDRYTQGYGALRTGERDDSRFCCLGVWEDVRGCEWEFIPDRPDLANLPATAEWRVVAGGQIIASAVLSQHGAWLLGLRDDDPNVTYWETETRRWEVGGLSVLNDRGTITSDVPHDTNLPPLTYLQIADVVEQQPADWDGSYDFARELRDRYHREDVDPEEVARGAREAAIQRRAERAGRPASVGS